MEPKKIKECENWEEVQKRGLVGSEEGNQEESEQERRVQRKECKGRRSIGGHCKKCESK